MKVKSHHYDGNAFGSPRTEWRKYPYFWDNEDDSKLLRHREDDLPALVFDGSPGSRKWFHHGHQHRIGGPAFMSDIPDYGYDWYLFGKEYDSFQSYAKDVKQFMTEAVYFVMVLTYGVDDET